MAETAWYDNICQKRKPTLEEKAELIKSIGTIHLNESAKRFYIQTLRRYLQELDKEYTPSLDSLANAIISILPTFLEKRDYQQFIDAYRKAISKHKEKITFQRNFE